MDRFFIYIFPRILYFFLGFVVGASLMSAQASADTTDAQPIHKVHRSVKAHAGSPPSAARSVIKIAVIDTGFSQFENAAVLVPLCKTGHYDFRTETETIGYDTYHHGTKMANIIATSANRTGYCLIIYNVNSSILSPLDTRSIVRAIYMATREKVKAINMSFTGSRPNRGEHRALWRANKRGIKLFVAAGNKQINLNKQCSVYPACYKFLSRMTVLGALDRFGHRASYSNYGRFLTWYPGRLQRTDGTSASTAFATGMFVRGLLGVK